MTKTIPMKRLLTTAALAAALMLPLPASAETHGDGDAALDAAMEAVSAESFAGALLAGQTAAFDNDLDRAVAYFRRALQYRPDDAGTNNQLFIALIFNGDLESAKAQAAKTTDEPQLVPLRELSLALAALSEERYDDAIAMLDDFGGSALDDLVSELLNAWALTGKGDPDAALAGLEALSGPPWYDLFVNYNAGAIAALSGDTAKARTYLNAALADREGGVTAPDTMLATVIGLAAIEQQAGNTRKALDTVSVAETYGLNAAVLEPIRERIEAGAPVMGLPETARAGAAVRGPALPGCSTTLLASRRGSIRICRMPEMLFPNLMSVPVSRLLLGDAGVRMEVSLLEDAPEPAQTFARRMMRCAGMALLELPWHR